MATLQHYTFHRCIHTNFTEIIHTRGIQPCFKKKKRHKNIKLMLIKPPVVRSTISVNQGNVADHITAQLSVCMIKKIPSYASPMAHIGKVIIAGNEGYILNYSFHVLVNR
jgi:hypothetical protein